MGKVIVGRADNRPRIWIDLSSDGIGVFWRVGHHGKPVFAANIGDAVNDALTHIGMVPAVIMWLKQEEVAHGED